MAMPYVALGDSYRRASVPAAGRAPASAGHGATPRSSPAGSGLDLDYRACLGARVSDVLGVQLDGLDAATELVTLTIGGNDAGFADVLRSAASPAWLSDSDTAIDGAEAAIAYRLPRLLTASTRPSWAAVHTWTRSPPPTRLFNGTYRHPLTSSPPRARRLNRVGDRLATVTGSPPGTWASRSSTCGRVRGHAVCGTRRRWSTAAPPRLESLTEPRPSCGSPAARRADDRPRRGRPRRSGHPRTGTARRPRGSGPARLDSEEEPGAADAAGPTGRRCARRGLRAAGGGGPAASMYPDPWPDEAQGGSRPRARWRRRGIRPWAAEGADARRARTRASEPPLGTDRRRGRAWHGCGRGRTVPGRRPARDHRRA